MKPSILLHFDHFIRLKKVVKWTPKLRACQSSVLCKKEFPWRLIVSENVFSFIMELAGTNKKSMVTP
jgi:hypothetical protein